MKYNEIQSMSPKVLEEQLVTAQALLRELRFSHAVSPIKNSMRIRNQRRLIARLRTALRVKKT